MVPKMVSILISPKSGSHSLASMAVASMPTGPLVPTQVRMITSLHVARARGFSTVLTGKISGLPM